MDLNKVMIIGRLVRDPETRTTPTGQNVTSFSVATGYSYTDKQGQKKEQTEFHNVVAWGKLGDIVAQYMKKGRQIYIEGRLQTQSWDDKTSGQKRYRTEIVATDMIMLGGGKDSAGGAPTNSGPSNQSMISESPAQAPTPDIQIDDSDMPF